MSVPSDEFCNANPYDAGCISKSLGAYFTTHPMCPEFPARMNDISECQSYGDKYIACQGKTAGRTIQSGSWPHVPYGCSVQKGGDWAIHWNTDLTGPNTSNADYQLLSPGPLSCPFAPSTVVRCADTGGIYRIDNYQKRNFTPTGYAAAGSPPAPDVPCSQINLCADGPIIDAPPPLPPCPAFPSSINSVGECQLWGDQFNKCKGKTPGRAIQIGAWPHVPYGCSVQTTGDWAIHWNSDMTGPNTSNNDFTLLSLGPPPMAPPVAPPALPPPPPSAPPSIPAPPSSSIPPTMLPAAPPAQDTIQSFTPPAQMDAADTDEAAAKRQKTLIILGAAGAIGLVLLVIIMKL
jgi:hypothetical protein